MKTQNLKTRVLGLLSLLLLAISLLASSTAYGMEHQEFTREGECWAEVWVDVIWEGEVIYQRPEAIRVSCDVK